MLKRGTIVRLAKKLLAGETPNQPLPGERGLVGASIGHQVLVDFEGNNRKWVPLNHLEVKPSNEEESYRLWLKGREVSRG